MKRLRLSRMAETDLRDIWTCSANRWGRQQANSYLGTLSTAITGLRDDTTPSRPAWDVLPACRKASVGRHVVIFRVGDDAVEVLRVLHQRRDAGRWVEGRNAPIVKGHCFFLPGYSYSTPPHTP